MDYTTRPYTHFTTIRNRPIVGLVLHNTEGTTDLTTAQSAGSWHWLIGRQGTIYRDVPEPEAAWAVAATNEWRPPWVLATPARYQPLSDANYCTVSIELVSGATNRAAGEPYTTVQYAALRVLLDDLAARRGPLPLVGHGQLQLDRTDPVAFDWHRAGLVWDGSRAGYFLEPVVPDPTPDPPVEDVTMLTEEQAAAVAALAWNERGVPFVPTFAIPAAWVSEWKAGRYRGLPRAGEWDGPDGTKVQPFDHGLAVWVPDQGVTWTA